jgi:tight adherence protein C
MRSSQLERRLFPDHKGTSPRVLSKLKVSWGNKSFDPFLLEVPQQIELMAAMLANGENFYSALTMQANLAKGDFATALKRVRMRLELGESLEVALELLERETNSSMVSEFANKVVIALTRGTPMAQQLEFLSETARARLRNQLLKQAGKNELKMLIPMVFMILPVTILFAVFPSLQLLQAGF